MLKAITCDWGSGVFRVVYAITEGRCLFSEVSGRSAESTVNVEDRIICAIVAQEGLDPNEVGFFDLITRLGDPRKERRKYELCRLGIDPDNLKARVNSWTLDRLTKEEYELFEQYL